MWCDGFTLQSELPRSPVSCRATIRQSGAIISIQSGAISGSYARPCAILFYFIRSWRNYRIIANSPNQWWFPCNREEKTLCLRSRYSKHRLHVFSSQQQPAIYVSPRRGLKVTRQCSGAIRKDNGRMWCQSMPRYVKRDCRRQINQSGD